MASKTTRKAEERGPEVTGRSIPIIRTKLHRPPLTDQLICRKRLNEHLDHGLETPLTVVSAPAGYGKSTLVSQWADSLDLPCAWLSLDSDDSELAEFTEYVLAAVETAFPGACPDTEAILNAPNPAPTPVLGASLVNELDAVGTPFVLVLDDYHRIPQSSDVHRLVGLLLKHPPQPLHLVIVTRRDPPLRLATLRAGNRITEVRLQDLRFTADESASMLSSATKQTVAEDALANLEREIEGWPAGLRLVSLAIRHATDPNKLLRKLHGGLPHTQEYLVREVLAGQPSEVRECLLRSSILDRFCPELLDAICASTSEDSSSHLNGQEFIDLLQTNNLFTIPLDVQGEWFRFHHLFQKLLHRQLTESVGSDEIAELHLRSAGWFESKGLITESIRHALAKGDADRAAAIIERHRDEEFAKDHWHVVERWLSMIPEEVKLTRPRLLLTDAWVAYCRMQLERIPVLIEQCETALGGQPVEDTLAGELAFFRGCWAYWSAAADGSKANLEEALSLINDKTGTSAGETLLVLSLARTSTGESELAITDLKERIRRATTTEGVLVPKLTGALFFVHLLSGDLVSAQPQAKQFRLLAKKNQLRNHEAWGDYFEGCIHLHALELTEASVHFARAVEQCYIFETRPALDAFSGLALAQQLLGQSDMARDTTERLQNFAEGVNDPECLVAATSFAARLSILQGEITTAGTWARSYIAEPDPGSLFMWIDNPLVTQARVLIAEGSQESLSQAIEALGGLREYCDAWRYTCQSIEIAVLLALALEKQGNTEESWSALQDALALAEPGCWLRPFVEAGPTIAKMLDHPDLEDSDFVRRLRSVCNVGGVPMDEPSTDPKPQASTTPGRPELDALTDRELDILELLQNRLYNKEIASKLCISTHTVNYHLKHIYSKLGVNTRRQAVRHAQKRGILNSTE